MQFEDCALKTDVFAFASRSKTKAKPQRRISVSSSTKTVPIGKRTCTNIEPADYSPIDYPVSKQLSALLRHDDLSREEDGAIEFWRLKDYLLNEFENSQYWSDELWKSKMAGDGGIKKRFQHCTDPSGQEILDLRALQGHSGRNLIDPSLQDNVLIPNDFFEYIYHIGCAINLHSIPNSGLIPRGQDSDRDRQTDGILYSVEETSKHGALGRHQTCSKDRIKVLSHTIERHHSLQHTPSLLYPKDYQDGN